jgi:hypothetical protein
VSDGEVLSYALLGYEISLFTLTYLVPQEEAAETFWVIRLNHPGYTTGINIYISIYI